LSAMDHPTSPEAATDLNAQGGLTSNSPCTSEIFSANDTATPLPVINGTPADELEERPSLSYKDLIIESIESSPEKRLKLSEIYQVIRYLHPYYRKRPDQWGWQNSIRHNLSLHDCFVKLPLKQTSANGVVGHYWTVVRDRADKQTSTRRRNRNGTRPVKSAMSGRASVKAEKVSGQKMKGRQSVSSDSGIVSDESQASSPSALLLDMSTLRRDIVEGSGASSSLSDSCDLQQLYRPTPVHLSALRRAQSTALTETNPTANLYSRLAAQNFLENATLTANAQMPTTPVPDATTATLTAELRRLHLLNLYLCHQGLLQQMLLDMNRPVPAVNNSPLNEALAQLLLAKATMLSSDGLESLASLPSWNPLQSVPNLTLPTETPTPPALDSGSAINALLLQQLSRMQPETANSSQKPTATEDVMAQS
jgi:hypothetical protein